MKHYAIALFTLIFFFTETLSAQEKQFEPSLKYGKPSNDELLMEVYQPDTTAVAIELFRKGDIYYEFISNNFRVNYTYERKFKILKNEGTSYADVSIPYYSPATGSNSLKESVVQIEATAYNMEDGKMVKTQMKKEFIFKERLNNKTMQVKFTIPGVKQGSVIEYKYKILSDLYYDLKNFTMQNEIPVLYSNCTVAIPEYFNFSTDIRGWEHIDVKDEKSNFNFGPGLVGLGKTMTFTGKNLPGLKNDNYVWCLEDYFSGIYFELNALNIPGYTYKSYTNTWEDIDKMLMADDEFGGQLKLRNPFKSETEIINLASYENNDEKIIAIFNLLKNKVSWNGEYALYGGNSKKAINERVADNAEINFILMSMLRDAGISSYPVVMSRRNRGVIPFTRPSLQKLNTFIVAIANTDSTMVYLDGSVNDGYLNVLPSNLSVERARIIYGADASDWVNLSNLSKNSLRSSVTADLSGDGKIKGTRITSYGGQFASSFRKKYRESKDSLDFINKLASNENMEIQNFKVDNLHNFSLQTRETIQFEKQITANDEYIYINPLVFLHTSKNPFIQSDRKLPVEFAHTENIMLSINIGIPEGYAIEEIPKAMTVKTEDGKGFCRYNIAVDGNRIVLKYSFNNDRLVFLPSEYSGLQGFWDSIAEKNNETIVLKKI